MLISRMIVALALGLVMVSTSWTQTLELPLPPAFPAEPSLLPSDPSRSPAPRRPQPTDAIRYEEVRPALDSANLPDQKELVSILKRKLPVENETIEVKDAPEWFQTMMLKIVRENVPDKYVQDKDWGKTDRRWDGVQLKRRGTLRWSTKRKWKEVNHGTWKRYEITQIVPQKNLTMRIENVRDAGTGKVGFDVRLGSKLHVFGRTAKWAKGVQVYNISADADADVELQIQCEVGMKLDIRRFPPDVIMAPVVTRADLDVTDFRLQKVSKLRGPLVRELSGSVHNLLMDKLEEKRDRLPQKINRQIAKNQDKMRLSLADFASSKWDALTGNASNDASLSLEKTKTDPEKVIVEPPSEVAAAIVPSSRKVVESFEALNSPQEGAGFRPKATLKQKRVELLDLLPPSG